MYLATNTNGLVGTFMIMWALGMMVVTIGLVLFGLSLIHAIQHKDIANRSLWLSVVILLPLIGSALYFMAILVPYNRTHPYVPKKSTNKS